MKITAILTGVLLVLMCGCDRKSPTTDRPPPIEPERASSASDAAAASPRAAATKEQIGSSVRVRVIAGALPVKNVTGAILDRQELPAAEAFFDQHRCVIALLEGWTEAQLRSEQAKILIFRNLPDERGQTGSHGYPGKLLQFDEKSGIALFSYFQGFSANTDLGFKIDRATPEALQAVALRFGNMDAAEEPPVRSPSDPARRATYPAMSVEEGGFHISAQGSGELEFPPGENSGVVDEAPLIAIAPRSLLGFASQTGTNAAGLVRIPPLKIAVQLPTIVPTSATFARPGGGAAQMTLKLERKDGAETLSRVWLRKSVLSPGTKMDLATLSEPFSPITETPGHDSWLSVNQEDNTVAANLTAPERRDEEITYLMQVAWAISDSETAPSLFSRPFLVKLAHRAVGMVATTEGINGPSDASPEKVGEVTTFALEAPVVRIVEIAEGREVLMQFLGDPFWKRFSMEKKAWLPLPPMTSSTVDLAGNRSSLIVLDRAAAEVRRYRLSDLTLAATTKLNIANEEVFEVRAGCLSDRAPIHVLCSGGPISLDAETLQRIEDSDARAEGRMNAEIAANYRASGDGVTLFSTGIFEGCFSFRGNILGLRRGYFDSEHCNFRKGTMVSAAFNLEEGRKVSTCANPSGGWKTIMELPKTDKATRVFAFQNAPVVARLVNGNRHSIPPVPPQMELFSLWQTEPIAVLPIPELAQIMGDYGEEIASKHLVCVDLQSRRLGILSSDQKSWYVRDFEFRQGAERPLIANWPDTTVNRGAEFRFEPRLLGEGRFSAELLGTKEPTPVTVDENGISFRVAENELASLLLLNVTVSGEGGSTASSIPIHVGGAPLPFVWPDLNPGINPDDFAGGFKSLIVSKDRRVALKSDFYASPDRILEILAPTSDILALVTDAKRVDFLSLSSRKVVGGMATTETTKFYAGCDALFEYDTNTRSLTRITVPDGQRGARLTLPADVHLEGIAMGSQRDHPVSLFLVRRENEHSAQLGNWNLTTWQNKRGLAVLNSETLQAGGWMQPSVWTDGSVPNAAEEALNLSTFGQKFPPRIVGSQNGSILQMRNHFGVITPRFALVAPYPDAKNGTGLYWPRSTAVEGSITGIVATSGGSVSRNGIIDDGLGALGTPCGRYVLVGVNSNNGGAGSYEVRSIENRQSVFRLNRLAALRSDPEQQQFASATGIQILRENGPAVVRSRGNKLLQLVDLDIPRVAAQVAPDSFHVTSQPAPLVMEGGIYEYQVKVNNPSLVKGYKLRQPPPSATISPTGMLRVSAPQNVRAPSRIPVSIEIEGKNGSTVLHNFSIIAISRQLPSTPPAKSKPPQTPSRSNVRRL